MATLRVPKIKEFPMDGRFWRVDWLSALEPNPQITTEPFLQIIISPFYSDPFSLPADKLSSLAVTDASHQKIIRVGVGQLPFIDIGSVWRDKVHQGIYAGTTEVISSLPIYPERIKIISAGHKVDGHYLVPYSHYRLGPGLGSQLVAVEHNGDPYGILIPAMELIRFYYAISTNLAHALFSGALQHNPDLIMNTGNTHYQADEDRVILGLRQQVTDEEGWVIARILRSETAANVCRNIYDGVIKDSVNNKYIQVTSGFPFVGTTSLTARVKKIPSSDKNKWRRLVLALEHCTAPMPYSELTIIRDNDASKASPTTDIPKDKKQTYIRSSGSASIDQNLELQSQKDTNAGLLNVVLKIASNRFGALQNRKPDKPTKEQCEYRSSGRSREDFKFDALGTGLGGYGEAEQRIQKASIAPVRNRVKFATQSFELFIAAVNHLNQQEGISANIRQTLPELNHMPLTKPSGKWQWGYLDSAAKRRRGVIIADITMNGRFYNLIEFEQRKNERCTACLLPTGYSKVHDRTLYNVLFQCSSKIGVWKNIKVHMVVVPLKHTWSDHYSFSSSIVHRL